MYASTSQSDAIQNLPLDMHDQRVDAKAAVSFKHNGKTTKLDRLYQQGSAKIRFPKHYDESLEAVLINTAGGLTGGDFLSWDVSLNSDCNAIITTQACEKSYKSISGAARVQTSLRIGKNSALHWVPQETILYNSSSLSRTFDVEMAHGSELLALESVMMGREAMGETVDDVQFHDRWRVRCEGKVIFADDLRIAGSTNSLAKFGKNRALASLLFVSSKDNETLRSIVTKLHDVSKDVVSGFSAFEGKITGRILASDTYALRQALVPVLDILRNAELPRVWRI